jgi:hypothetical protein
MLYTPAFANVMRELETTVTPVLPVSALLSVIE